jgi:serine/threonine protein kinase
METIDHNIEVLSEIGRGAWCVVHNAYMKSTGEEVAVKVEKSSDKISLLLREAKIMEHLQGIEGVPLLHKFGTRGDTNYMVMQKLHCTLSQLRKQGLLKSDEVLRRGEHLMTTIEQIHKRGIIHQDLQPANLMTASDLSTSYFIDFGLATSVSNQRSYRPRVVGMIGTPSYASLNSLLGLEQDFRDDLEALGYIFARLIVGKLPWEEYSRSGNLSGLKAAKFNTAVSAICQGCPDELIHYFNYVRRLQFKDVPDYHYLRTLLQFSGQKVQIARQMTVNTRQRERFNSEDITGKVNRALKARFDLSPGQEAASQAKEDLVRMFRSPGGADEGSSKGLNLLDKTEHPPFVSLGKDLASKSQIAEIGDEANPEYSLRREATKVIGIEDQAKVHRSRKVRRNTTLTRKKRESTVDPSKSRFENARPSNLSIEISHSPSTNANSPATPEVIIERQSTKIITLPSFSPDTKARIAHFREMCKANLI